MCILENATNGDTIIKRKLDECVSDTGPDWNDPDYAITVDLNLMMDGKGGENQIGILKAGLPYERLTTALLIYINFRHPQTIVILPALDRIP
jgi:hypothetical protein